MAEKFDEFIDDIEKDIRHERFEKLWKEYGKAISAAIIGALALSTGWFMWNSHQDKQLKLTSEKFIKAQSLIDKGDIIAGLNVYDSTINDGAKTYSPLAQLAKATVLLEKGGEDTKKGVEQLTKLASDTKADVLMRDFAALALIRRDIDYINPKEINDQLKGKLAAHIVQLDTLATEKSPWRLLALDLKGIILFTLNDYAKASEAYIAIAQTENCPKGILARAEIMSQLSLKHIQAAA